MHAWRRTVPLLHLHGADDNCTSVADHIPGFLNG